MLRPDQQALRLRAELKRRRYPGVEALTHAQLTRISMTVATNGGDIDIAATAIIQWPRPIWIANIIGPGSMPDLELLHPDDRATEGNW